ncbi:valine--tRNA ligase [Candidatus Amesbacteria bacterium]|nr:valine--tRNA ligase [Candidatus Amesbacteria bacterium]
MDKNYDQSKESDIYKRWEESGSFAPKGLGKPFTIIMPPPNANDPLHVGHAMFVSIEDILTRYHRMKGDSTLWLPGTDHAGIETQYVFEKKLVKQGKSRFDFDRDTLYKMIWDYVQENSSTTVDQMKRLGASSDWKKFKFTLDSDIVDQVTETFINLYQDGLVYRDKKLVNYCTKCGTSYSELEVNHVEETTKLYFIKYGPFVLATTRPETKFADTAVAVHPSDKRYIKYIGQEIEVDGLLGKFKLNVIADEYVDPKFGTGVVKITPFHDFNDYEVWQRHKNEIPEPKQVIGFDGKLTEIAGKYSGLKIKAARELIEKDLQTTGLLEKVNDKYVHTIGTCYRCGSVLEPLPLLQFFIKVKSLAQKALKALDSKETVVFGAGREKILRNWLTNLKDWNISRQIVWGIRIPAWYRDKQMQIRKESPGEGWIQEIDSFDTWFSSGQWPVITLKSKPGDFEKFYPTTIMETGYDILPIWVVRMMLLGIYMTGKSPFKQVYLHGLIRDEQGRKMSKSVGNVINPLEMVDKYGADAIRMALVISSTPGQDKSVGESTIRGMRNFSNKIWNAARFVKDFTGTSKDNQEFIKKINSISSNVSNLLENLKIGLAAETVYNEFWHWFCDSAIEEAKAGKINKNQILWGLKEFLKLLHPFMPFVTESIWQELGHKDLLITASWPK